MVGRALLAFLICPGIVAYGLPGLLIRSSALRGSPARFLGRGAVAFGTGLLLWCIRDFLVEGRGTLAPWAPPKNLVQIGLYRFSRNPMYLAVGLVLVGWATLFQSMGLILYAASVLAAFHLRVVYGEEPWLAKRYGKEWDAYRARVPRWLMGRLT